MLSSAEPAPDDPLAEDRPVGTDELDGVAGNERTLAADDADREQAPSMRDERLAGAVVDDDAGDRRLRVPEPEPERTRTRTLGGGEARSAPLARGDRPEHVRPAPRRDHRRDPGRRRDTRRRDLARHAPAPELARLAEGDVGRLVAVGDERRARSGRMLRVDAVDLGQEHEQARAHEQRGVRRERVVVAERDLVGRGRVVLVHDRDDAELQQRAERVAQVHVARAVTDVGGGEEHLRGLEPFAPQGGAPRALEPRLPDGRRRLKLRCRAAAAAEPEPREPERDCARGHDADSLARAHERSDLRDAVREERAAHAPVLVDDERRAQLDDDGHRCCVPSPTTRYWRRQRSRYVTGPRGPGAASTFTPVSGVPSNSKPSVKRVVAFQKAAVPR